MNLTQQRTLLNKLTELALMMQIADSFKTVSPQYYNDRMAVLEAEYKEAVRELAESVKEPSVCPHEWVLHTDGVTWVCAKCLRNQ